MANRFQTGVVGTIFPSTPILFSLKNPKRNNILIGNDEAQKRFSEDFFNLSVTPLPVVKDEDLLGKIDPVLIQVDHPKLVELSTQVLSQTGIFSIIPLEKGSAGLNAIVRHACQLLDIQKPSPILVQRTADLLATEEILDIKATLWKAVYLLTGPAPEEFKLWPEPWTSKDWLPKNVDPQYRLN